MSSEFTNGCLLPPDLTSMRRSQDGSSRNYLTGIVALLLLLWSATGWAVALDSNVFAVFRGDVDGDGIEDLYLEHRDEVFIFKLSPLRFIPRPSAKTYLLRGLNNGRYAEPETQRIETEALIPTAALSADFTGDGLTDFLLSESPSYLVLLAGEPGDLAPVIVQQFAELGGRKVSDAAAVIRMEDLNGDGFADLIATWPEGTQRSFINAGTGAWAFSDDPTFMPEVAADNEPKFGLIGDSIAAGTHTTEMCGNRDIVDCLDYLGGRLSPEWNYGTGNVSWSIASRLGYDPAHVYSTADSGERWKDAMPQAERIVDVPGIDTVMIGLGANDVCRDPGHFYGDDLAVIASQIDQTLGYLTERLPVGGEIILIGVPDVVRLRELMREQDHNIMFESCQATWDLSANQIKDGAASSACDHFGDHDVCSVIDNTEDGKDFLLRQLLDIWKDAEGIESGPCGKVLSSDATATDRAEAADFTRALNRLLGERALAFSGRNGVTVSFSDAIYRLQDYAPHHVSRFDCYHPSRAGQKLLADAIWSGMRPGAVTAETLLLDRFESVDFCATDADPWRTCWTESDNDSAENGDVYIEGGRLRIRDNVRTAARGADLGDVTRAWLSFNARRKELDRSVESVIVEMSADDGASWSEITRIRGDGDDYGQQRGDYHQISGFTSDATLLRLRSERLGNKDEVQFDNIQLFAWSSTLPAGPSAVRPLSVGGDWQAVSKAQAARPSVLLAGPASQRGGAATQAQFRNQTRDSFEIRLLPFMDTAEPEPETVSVLAFEEGVYLPGDASIWEAGSAVSGSSWTHVDFSASFDQVPRLFLDVQASGAPTPPLVRARNVSESGFEMAVFGGSDATVGFLAVQGGEYGSMLHLADGSRSYQTASATISSAAPTVLGAMLGSQDAQGWRDEFTVEVLRIGDQLIAREITEAAEPSVLLWLDRPL